MMRLLIRALEGVFGPWIVSAVGLAIIGLIAAIAAQRVYSGVLQGTVKDLTKELGELRADKAQQKQELRTLQGSITEQNAAVQSIAKDCTATNVSAASAGKKALVQSRKQLVERDPGAGWEAMNQWVSELP